jgi:hypothetical protein
MEDANFVFPKLSGCAQTQSTASLIAPKNKAGVPDTGLLFCRRDASCSRKMEQPHL